MQVLVSNTMRLLAIATCISYKRVMKNVTEHIEKGRCL